MPSRPGLERRIPHLVFVTKLRFTASFQQWLNAHEDNTPIRNGCCQETKTLVFRSTADPSAVVALLLEDVDYEAFKKYLGEIGYSKLAQSTEVYMMHRCLPPGLPPGCLSRCLGGLVPIHGHFIGLWTIEPNFDKWLAYHSSEQMLQLRSSFGVPIDLYKCITDPTKVLGVAADVNWKAVMRFLGSRELYESVPAARRAGEVDMVLFDGAKTDREKDVMGPPGEGVIP